MKSGTSFFNKSFSLHLLRRFWPLWCLWLAVLILVGPLNLGTILPANYDSTASYVNNLNRLILDSGRIVCCLAVFAGALMAMAMLSWLYNPRTCGLVCSLPLKRETLWCTAFLTGLVPMLAAEVLVFLLLLARFGAVPGVVHAYLRTWLAASALSTAGFYGFACFCGVLTGNVLILPAVYAVLGIAAGRVCSMVVSAWKGWPVAPSAAAIAMSVAVSATIGVAFGFYPAWRASRLNPIDALRYE